MIKYVVGDWRATCTTDTNTHDVTHESKDDQRDSSVFLCYLQAVFDSIIDQINIDCVDETSSRQHLTPETSRNTFKHRMLWRYSVFFEFSVP